MGSHVRVYLAQDTQQREPVVIKVFRNDADEPAVAAAMFEREMGALELLNHPNIVRKQRTFNTDEGPAIALEYVTGGLTLAKRITQGSRPLLTWRIQVLQDVLSAVQHAHAMGVIHRDLSLNNLLLDTDENKIKLSDFGLAKLKGALEQDQQDAQTVRGFGSPPFTAPEQLQYHEPDTRSDFYSFGVLMVAILTWQTLPLSFTRSALESTLSPLERELPRPTFHHILSFLKDALDGNPAMRPKVFEFQDELRRLAVDATPPQRVGLRLTQRTAQELQGRELTRRQLQDDFNDSPKGILEVTTDVETGEPSFMIKLYGRSAFAILRPDRNCALGQETLFVATLTWPDVEQHRKQRSFADDLPLTVFFTDHGNPPIPATILIDLLRIRQAERELEKTARAAREAYLAIPRRMVNFQKSQLKGVTIRYRARTNPGKRFFTTQRDSPFRVTVEGVERVVNADSASGSAPGQSSVAAQFEQAYKSDLQERATAYLPDNRRPLARVEAFRRMDARLTLLAFQKQRLPQEGTLQLVDPAAFASVNRQEQALNAFEQGEFSNPALAKRIMTPEGNDLNAAVPLEPIQDILKSDPNNHRLLGKALAAEDLFLVQGPPGTGKTTLIVDLVGQILKEKPYARVLVTSQSNKAVDVVLNRIAQVNPAWRCVRFASESWEDGEFPTFSESFSAWLKSTQENALSAIKNYQPRPGEHESAVLAAMSKWAEHMKNGQDLQPQFLEGVSVIGATCNTVGVMRRRLNLDAFDWVIFDEAARATTAEALIPLLHGRRAVLVGDHKQLPPFLDQATIEDLKTQRLSLEEAKRSLFETLFSGIRETNRVSLRNQHRMHSSIAQLVGDVYYPEIGGLESIRDDATRPMPVPAFNNDMRVHWIDVRGKPMIEAGGRSSYNMEEVTAIQNLLTVLSDGLEGHEKQAVSIISPYAAQIRRIKTMVAREQGNLPNLKAIRVGTVDSFQGEEDDILICSLVRLKGSARHVTDEHRLNVTFSRAINLLLIVGNHADAAQHPKLREVVHPSYIPHDHVWRSDQLSQVRVKA